MNFMDITCTAPWLGRALDATSGLIAAEAAFLEKQGARASAPCNASAHAAPKAAADCSRTRVAGLPGTGSARRQSCLGQRVSFGWMLGFFQSALERVRAPVTQSRRRLLAHPLRWAAWHQVHGGGLAAVLHADLHADHSCGTSTTRPNLARSF